jgi:hypothetical protein
MTNLSVLTHHGANRTEDPLKLQRHKVVVTTYDVVKSEYSTFALDAKDESKKAKSKESRSESDELESDEAEHFGRTVKTLATTGGKKKKTKDALYRVKWFRIVLGRWR